MSTKSSSFTVHFLCCDKNDPGFEKGKLSFYSTALTSLCLRGFGTGKTIWYFTFLFLPGFPFSGIRWANWIEYIADIKKGYLSLTDFTDSHRFFSCVNSCNLWEYLSSDQNWKFRSIEIPSKFSVLTNLQSRHWSKY